MTSFLSVFEFQLQTDPVRSDLLRLYVFQQSGPQDFSDWGLLFRDKVSGLFYLELMFPKRAEKEAFYATHRLIHAVLNVDVFGVIQRLGSGHREEGKSNHGNTIYWRV